MSKQLKPIRNDKKRRAASRVAAETTMPWVAPEATLPTPSLKVEICMSALLPMLIGLGQNARDAHDRRQLQRRAGA